MMDKLRIAEAEKVLMDFANTRDLVEAIKGFEYLMNLSFQEGVDYGANQLNKDLVELRRVKLNATPEAIQPS